MLNKIKYCLLLSAVLFAETYFGQCSPGPSANFNFTSGDNQCGNSSNPISNTSTGTGLTYQWNFGNPASGANNTSVLQNPSHEFIGIGDVSETFNVQLIVTDGNGCRDTIIKSITKKQTPELALIDPNTNFRNCVGSGNYALTVFDVSSLSTNVDHTIIWGDGTANFNSVTFPGTGVNHTYGPSGVFDLIYIVTGQNGCKDTIVIPVASTTNPSIGLATLGGTSGCAPLTPCFPITNTNSNHSTTFYVVDYGDGTAQDTFSHPPPAQFCHTYLTSSCPISPTGLTVTITATNLCNATIATVNGIQVFTPPIPNISTNPAPICVNTAATINNNTVPGYNSSCSRFTAYTWDFGDGTSQTVNSLNPNSITHVYTTPGVYRVILSTSNSCGAATDTAFVCVEAPPVPNFTANPTSSCVPFNVTTTNLSSAIDVCSVSSTWSTTFDQVTCNPTSGNRVFANGTTANSFEPQFTFTDPGIYSIVLAATNSCGTITHTEQIIAQTIPDVNINPVTSICGGQSVTPTAVINDCQESIDTYLWDFTGSATANSGQEVPGTVTYNTNGSYTITLTATNSCGSDIATTTLTVNDIPPALNPFTISPLCAGYDAQFLSDTVVNATYTWTGPNGFTSNLQNPIITNVTPADAGTYSVFASFGTCFGASQSVDLIILPLTFVDAGNNFSNCIDDAAFTINSATPAGGVWSGNGVNAGGFFNPSAAGPGTHSLVYTFTDPGTNCVYSDSLVATVNALPIVDAGADLSLCSQPIANTLTPITPINGIWSGPGITNPNGEFTPSVNGAFEIFYSFTDGNGCFNEDTVIINVIDPTIPNAGIDQELCYSNVQNQLTGSPIGGTWAGTVIAPNGSFTPNNPGVYELVYFIGNGNCLASDTMILTIYSFTTVEAGLNREFCESDLATNFIGSPLGGTWSGNGIVNATFGAFDPSAANNNGLPNIITYSFTDNNNCTNTDSLEAIVHELPTVLFNYNPIVCAGINENFTNNSLLGDQFQWNFGDNSPFDLNENPTHSYTNSGFFTIQLNVTSIFGCVDSLRQNIEVREPPIADFTIAPDSACGPLNVNFTNLSSGIGFLTYNWDFGNGQFSSNQNPPNVIYQAGIIKDTSYIIRLDVTNFCGTISKLDSVKVMPKPKAIFGPLFDTGCSPYTADFSNVSVGLPDNYSWDFGNGVTSTTNAGLFSQIFVTGTSDTIFTIRLIASNECGVDTAYHDIHILPTSVDAFFNTNITNGCAPLQVDFTSFSAGATQFNWDFGDGNVSSQAQVSNTFMNPGTYNVRLIVNDDCSKDTSFVSIVVHPRPNINFTFTPTAACINTPFNFTNLSSGVSNLTWDFGDGLNSTVSNPSHSYATPGNYQVVLSGTSTLFACQSSFTKNLSVVASPIAAVNVNTTQSCVPTNVNFVNNSTNFLFK